MTYETQSETACACRPNLAHMPEYQIDSRASESARQLDSYAERFGPRLAEAITVGAIGQGPLAHRFSPIGTGAEAARHAQPGDILIARGLFPESDPRVDIVGFDPKLDLEGLMESLDAPDAVELYRPTGDGDAVSLAAVGAGTLAVLKGLNSAADLRLKYEQIRVINESNRQPSFTSEVVSLIDPRYRTGNEKTSVYRFQVVGKRRGTIYDSPDYKADFDVTVLHDCINILEARVTSRNREALGLVLPYKLTVNVTKSTHSAHRLPPLARMHIAVSWNPDRASDWVGGNDQSYEATAELQIRADGQVRLKPGVTNREVRITGMRTIRPSAAGCATLYAQMRDRSANTPAQNTIAPPPQTLPSGGRYRPPPRRRRPVPKIEGPTSAALPHPKHGRNIFFGFRSVSPEAYALQEVKAWWNRLPPAVKASLISGQRSLYVTGHADYTGSDRFNLGLSSQRAQAIARLIQQVAGRALKMRVQGMGWRSARNAGQQRGRPNQDWRRVTISVDNPG